MESKPFFNIQFGFLEYSFNQVIICRYTLLSLCDFTASATTEPHLIWLGVRSNRQNGLPLGPPFHMPTPASMRTLASRPNKEGPRFFSGEGTRSLACSRAELCGVTSFHGSDRMLRCRFTLLHMFCS